MLRYGLLSKPYALQANENSVLNVHVYELLTTREEKMAVYWVSSIFGCLWTETKSRAKNTQKENEADIQPSNLFNKGFIVWNTIYLRGTASNSERPREFHLARSGSQ